MGLRFNPPPGWPAPPEGFTPDAGWQPDPSWPPPPPGWQLWVPDDQPAGQGGHQPARMPLGQPAVQAPADHGVPGPGGGEGRPAPTSGWAIASFVLGLLSVVVLSVIFGIIALTRIRRLGQKGRGLAIAGLVLSAAWVVVAIVLAIVAAVGAATRSSATGQITGRGHLGPFSLKTGDCFNNPAGAQHISAVTAIPCTQPHNAQVFAQFQLTGSDFSYPGTATVLHLASDGCDARTGSVSKAKTTRAMTIRMLFPQQISWTAGHRTVSCLLVNPTADLRSSLLKTKTAG